MRSTIMRRLGVGLPAVVLAVVAVLLLPPGPTAAADQPYQETPTLLPDRVLLLSPEAAADQWHGTAPEEVNVRGAPTTAAPIVAVLQSGSPVTVARWVSGEEVQTQNTTWAQLGEGRYVYSAVIRKDAPTGPPPLPGEPVSSGKWIDVNLTQQVMTAYEGSTPVHAAVTSSGRPDYPTPRGRFTIQRRVANETMTSAGLPWVKDSYALDNVLFTQYFTNMGAAIHEAWWKEEDSFGIPTSHACLGLPHAEAQWFWNWAEIGTPMSIHD